jgi:hypothetical protein
MFIALPGGVIKHADGITGALIERDGEVISGTGSRVSSWAHTYFVLPSAYHHVTETCAKIVLIRMGYTYSKATVMEWFCNSWESLMI